MISHDRHACSIEGLDNVMLAGFYLGLATEMLVKRQKIKHMTIDNRQLPLAEPPLGSLTYSLDRAPEALSLKRPSCPIRPDNGQ